MEPRIGGAQAAADKVTIKMMSALLEEMKQAKDLVPHLVAPKTIRILVHADRVPDITIQAFDVLANKNVFLSQDAEWDGDGEVSDEEVSEEESDITSLPSDDDE